MERPADFAFLWQWRDDPVLDDAVRTLFSDEEPTNAQLVTVRAYLAEWVGAMPACPFDSAQVLALPATKREMLKLAVQLTNLGADPF